MGREGAQEEDGVTSQRYPRMVGLRIFQNRKHFIDPQIKSARQNN